jgi:LEA14-like dessication related protein
VQESFVLDNPNYVNLEVKLFTGAVYYNDTSLGEWDFKPSTISMRDDKVLVILTLVTCSTFKQHSCRDP